MATITEDYVSFETAKLLKEKGFNWGCYQYYNFNDGNLPTMLSFKHQNGDIELDEHPTAPTLQMAMKWLRIEHNIHIEPHIVKTRNSYGYMPNFIDLKKLKPYFPFDADEFDFSNADKYACITYEEACEVAIKYCLDLI